MQTVTELENGPSLALFQLESLAEEAERVLGESAYADLRRLRCDCTDGVVCIRGRVPSYFLKQMAQTAVSRIPGVRRVVNQITVP